MRLLCFFGSGISKPSGMPMTDAITDAIFSAQWHRHTDETFYPGPGGTMSDGVNVAALAQAFLRTLSRSASGYLSSRQAGAANYEHLFSLAKTVEDELSGESLNPALGDFVARTTRETTDLWNELASPSWSGTANNRLASLAREAQVLIESVVRNRIDPEMRPRGYQALLALLKDTGNFDHIDLVTLNHDLLLERLMEREKIDYCDGFSIRDGDVRLFDKAPPSVGGRIHLIKPHGAVNWHLYRLRPNDFSSDCHGGPDPGVSAWHARRANGNWHDKLSGNPVFLTGVDKIGRYSTGIFGRQIAWFRHSLERTNRVLCSGYGWRDAGINVLISEWLYSDRQHRLVLLHDSRHFTRDIKLSPAPWVSHYQDLQEAGQLKIIPKWLCCCKDATEILAALT